VASIAQSKERASLTRGWLCRIRYSWGDRIDRGDLGAADSGGVGVDERAGTTTTTTTLVLDLDEEDAEEDHDDGGNDDYASDAPAPSTLPNRRQRRRLRRLRRRPCSLRSKQ